MMGPTLVPPFIAEPDFRSLFDATPLPHLILEPNFTIVAVNEAFLKVMHKSREEMLGRNLFQVFPENPLDPAANGAAHLHASLMRVLRHKLPDKMVIQKYALAVNAQNGATFEERYWSMVNVPVFNAKGEINHILHCAEDVTDFANARTPAALVEPEIHDQTPEIAVAIRLIADAIPQMVWVADAAGHAIFFNQQWTDYTGIPTGPIAAEEVSQNFIHPDDDAYTIEAWNEALKSGHIFNLEHRIRSASGEYRWFLVRAEPYRDPETGEIVQWFGTSTDVHDHKMAQAALKQSEERYRSLFNSIDEGFCIIEIMFDQGGNPYDYRFCEVNPTFEQQTGLHDVAGKTMRELAPNNEQHWFDIYGRVAVTGEPIRFENEAKALNRWFDVYAFRADDPGANKVAILFKDITDRKQIEAQTRHASLHDPLTGLPNRAMLYEYASHLLSLSHRKHHCTAVLFFDLDRFKPINDTHGHEAGDVVLKEVASRFAKGIRAEDIAFRLGGDEFVVLLQDIKSATYAADVTHHLLEKICEPYYVGDLSLTLSASVGISIFPDDGQDIDTLLGHADMAMYQAKQSGRNNSQFYSPKFAAGSKRQEAIEQQLKSALRDDAFHLCYQPVLDVTTGEIVSVEALLRWQNAEVGPDLFVPIAETTGIINPIGRWLLEEAARQHKAWVDHGLGPIPIAVNVSVVEFRDKDFVNRFQEIIHRHGIDMNALQVEVTETAVMDQLDHAVLLLSQLKALGVTVLLDDFGTGHSSLAYLARLPLSKIKIDKSFISRMESDIVSRAVTDAMIALGRTLKLEVVAEGIESENALDYISSHGCTQAQGFYLGKPMSGESFESWYWEHGSKVKGAGTRHSQSH